jgi:hypothetical protein
MITIKCKDETVEPKDIEIIWTEYSYIGSLKHSGSFEDYARWRYSEGYDDGLESRIAKSGGW